MKRQVDSDSEVIDSDRDRTKRARQYINLDGDDDAEMADATDTATEDDMDTDTVAAPANRSTLKRGRSDAGSVVGDSVRERKMRRKGPSSTGHTRGKKRAVETSGSEDEASGPANKRGRLSSGDEGDSDEGMHEDSDEEAQATQDSTHAGTATETSTVEPVCGDREIGDAWTEGDVKFKVGEDGRRLRLAHVKSVHTRAVKVRPWWYVHMMTQADSNFTQAKDIAGSPVKSTGLTPIQQTVVVERWLNDDEFAQVKSRKELAWGYDTDEEGSVDADEGQFTSARTKKAHQLTVTISDDSTSQMGGKVLLWDSGSRFSSRPSTPGGSTQPSPNTIAPSSKLQNPFHTVSVPTLGRRVASSAGGIQVPPLRYSRSFSKWEKMEAEADALERLRRGDRDEQKKKEAAAAPPTPAPAPVAASPSPFNLKPSDATPAALSSQPSPAPQATAAPASANPLFAPTSAATETATASKPAMPVFSLGTPVTTPPSSATAPAPPKPVFSFGPAPVTTPAPITVAPAAPVSAPSFPSFNIPTNPLNIAPGDKSATAAPSASGFSFGPTAAATTDKKDQPAASGLAAFVKPAGSTGGLASISFGPSAPGTTPAPATVTAPAPAPTGFSFGPAAASGAAASRPAFPGLGAAGSSSGAATPSATAAPASNLFSFGPAAPAAPTAAKPAAPGFSFGPASGTPAAAPATAPAPTTAGASSGFSFTGTGAAQKPSGFSFGPAATTVPTPMSTNAPAGAAAAPGFSFGPTTTAPAPTQAPAPGQTPNLFTPAPGANLAGGNPFAPTGGNPFASSANPGTMNAQGRPMRGRSSLSGKPPGTASSPAPGATASANLFSFASTPGAAAPVASASSPFGFSSAAPASAAGAAAQPSLFSFGPAAGVTQQPAQNPPFGGSAFSFGQK